MLHIGLCIYFNYANATLVAYALHFCNFTHCIGLLCDLLSEIDRCKVVCRRFSALYAIARPSVRLSHM